MLTLSKSHYQLELGKNQTWALTASPNCQQWLAEFARILQLQQCEGEAVRNFCSLFFCTASETLGLQESLSQKDQELKNGDAKWSAVPLGRNRLLACHPLSLFIVEIQDTDRGLHSYQDMWYSLQPVYRRTLEIGGLPVHGAVLLHGDEAILVAASGGTGKSTFARHAAGSWRSISDDEAIILPAEVGGFKIHPMPTWSDYLLQRNRQTWDVQTGYTLKGITFLKRAETETESTSPMGQGTASILLVQSASQVLQKRWQDSSTDITVERRKKLFQVAATLVREIPAYTLNVSKRSTIWDDLTATILNGPTATEAHERSHSQRLSD